MVSTFHPIRRSCPACRSCGSANRLFRAGSSAATTESIDETPNDYISWTYQYWEVWVQSCIIPDKRVKVSERIPSFNLQKVFGSSLGYMSSYSNRPSLSFLLNKLLKTKMKTKFFLLLNAVFWNTSLKKYISV